MKEPIQIVVKTLSGEDAIIPVRLSQKARHHKQTGLETQDEDAVRWAEENGFNVVAVISDFKTGSGDWMQRKNLRPWLTDPVKRASYQHIICPTQDRLSRGRWRDEIAIRTWAEDNGIEIWIVDTGLHWPPATLAEQRAWDQGATSAREEYEKTRKRNERNQRKLGSDGYLITKPCFGTMVVRKDGHKTLAPDPEYAPTAIEMVDRAIAGQSRYDIARWLTAAGIPVPNDIRRIRKADPDDPPRGIKWHPKTVDDTLRNRALVGERRQRFGGTLQFPPILAKEDGTPDYAKFQRLQRALDASSKRRGKLRDKPAMLSGIAYCGKCKRITHAKFTVTKVHGHEYHWAGYRCDGSHLEPSTCKVMARMDKTDAIAWEATELYEDFPYFAIDVKEGHDWKADLQDNADRLAMLDQDAPNYDEEHARLRAERKDLQNRRPVKPKVVRQQKGTIGDRRKACTTPEQRRELLLELGWKFYVLPPEKRGGDPDVKLDTGDYFEDLANASGLPDAGLVPGMQFEPGVWDLLVKTGERAIAEADASAESPRTLHRSRA